uniref:Uncharacterized protein n=1 Tax=Strigamia maritima TaxID=126957 RepID=T1JAN9_STRMM
MESVQKPFEVRNITLPVICGGKTQSTSPIKCVPDKNGLHIRNLHIKLRLIGLKVSGKEQFLSGRSTTAHDRSHGIFNIRESILRLDVL